MNPANAAALSRQLEQIKRVVNRLPSGTGQEVIVAAPEEAGAAIAAAGALHVPSQADYGSTLRAAVDACSGDYIVTLEAGHAQSAFIIPELYARRAEADILIASRMLQTGYSNAKWLRHRVSKIANWSMRKILDLNIRDLTSSYRLYRRRVFEHIKWNSSGFDALVEILVRSHAAGFQIREIPFHYFPEKRGFDSTFFANARRTAGHMFGLWRLRNSIECADYDERAHRSRIWFQRSWQQKRYHALVGMSRDVDRILDIGCGSSQVLDGLPQADGCDVRLNKLRHKRGRSRALVRASVFELPFKTNGYQATIFSQVIEHLPRDPRILQEVIRVTEPGGYVIIGTPDYATWWTTIEKIYGFVHPDGYADEHITHYTFDTLKAEVEALGCTFVDHAYVYHAELIMRFRKNG